MSADLLDSPAAILAAYLVAQGTFGDPEASGTVWPLFVNRLPDADAETVPADDVVPDSAGAIFDTAGLSTARVFRPPYDSADFYGIQVRVRAQKDEDAWKQLNAACAKLQSVNGASQSVGPNDYTIACVNKQSTPLFLGVEEGTKRRVGFTVNFLATIQPAP